MFCDVLRVVAQGRSIEAFGFGPDECAYRITAQGPFWRLRDYDQCGSERSLLIVAAPIKRPYIWDLAPSLSTTRYCLRSGLRVRLLEWLPVSGATDSTGLREYVTAIGDCVGKIAGSKPVLVGHSLGGTLAALYAAVASQAIDGLVLLGAPLCFTGGTSGFWDTLVSLVPSGLVEGGSYPGSLVSQVTALASPRTFVWGRLRDAALSLASGETLEAHTRIERWTLDECPLPRKLVHQIIEWLCRENRFCQGSLDLGGGSLIGPRSLSVPTLAVINTMDEIAPLKSVTPFIEAMPSKDTSIIEYPGETGVGLQHLGVLIGRNARVHVWPKIISWIRAHCRSVAGDQREG